MAETYCGKNCAVCESKEKLGCPGCRVGPGRTLSGDCELAQCCRDKGHETCETCAFRANCGTLRRKDNMADYRRRRQEGEALRRQAAANRAPVLAKWLNVLFWLIIPRILGSFMTNVREWIPALYIPGEVLGLGVGIVYGLILLTLGSEDDGFRRAGICSLVALALNLVTTFFGSQGWMLVISLIAMVISLVGEYAEFTAYGDVLQDVDRELSDKWHKLWTWNLGSMIAMFAGLIVMLLLPLLGALVVLAGAIAVIVVSILKLVYLYRTAKIFQAYAA